MVRISIDNIKDGMITAEAVEVQGRLLVKKGALLSRNHLRIFKTWGVHEVAIEREGTEPTNAAAKDPMTKNIGAVCKKIDFRFQKCNQDDEVIRELKRVVLERTIEGLPDGTASTEATGGSK
jgi:hypothetical protein